MKSLYHNEGKGFFLDASATSGLGRASLLNLTFGAFFFDYDLDGWLDIFLANGHVENDVQRVQENVSYAQPPHLMRNLGGGRFRDEAAASPDLARPDGGAAARPTATSTATATSTWSVSTSGGPARVFRNLAPARGVRVQVRGREEQPVRPRRRGPAAARARAGRPTSCAAAARTARRASCPRPSASAAPPPPGPLEVRWPSGTVDTVASVAAGESLVVEEGRGAVERRPLKPPR